MMVIKAPVGMLTATGGSGTGRSCVESSGEGTDVRQRCMMNKERDFPAAKAQGEGQEAREAGGSPMVSDEDRGGSAATSSGSPFFEWRDAWKVNIGFMDDDHQSLAAMLNDIAERFCPDEGSISVLAGRAAGSSCSLADALGKLGRHAREHFDREEAFMRDIRYPDLSSHKTDHDLLMAEYTELLLAVRSGGAKALGPDTLDALKRWLMGHVLDADKQLATFYFEKRGSGPSEPCSE